MKNIATNVAVFIVTISAMLLMQVGFGYAEQLNPIQNGQKIVPDGVPANVAVQLEQDAQSKVDALNEGEQAGFTATVSKGGAVAFLTPSLTPTPPTTTTTTPDDLPTSPDDLPTSPDDLPTSPLPPIVIYPPTADSYPALEIHLPEIPVLSIPPTSFTMVLKGDSIHVYIDIFTFDPATGDVIVTTYEYVIPFTQPWPPDWWLGPGSDIPPGTIVG